jgi:hypothetical protein
MWPLSAVALYIQVKIICTVDYQNDEPVLWMCTTSGHVIIAKFINKELLIESGVRS